MSEMTVKEIVADWLKEHGCEGLCDDDCGCVLDDLMPCGGEYGKCVAAVKGPVPPEYGDGYEEWLVPKQFPCEAKGVTPDEHNPQD